VKWLLRAVLALVALAVLAVAALAVLAPRLIDRPEVHERIAAAAKEATGRTLRYEKLGIGLLPPRLEASGVSLEGGPKDEPLRAERIALEVALLPLLARTVLVDALVVRGVEVTLVRTARGIELPFELRSGSADTKAPKDADAKAPGAAPGGVSVAVREVRIEKSRITLQDRSVRPAVEWPLEALDARARGHMTADAPIAFDVTARLAGAKLSAEGEATLAGHFDAKLRLAGFPLERLAPYLPPELRLSGPADVEYAPEGEATRFSGPLSADLTRAELARGESFRKPAGDRATFAGRLLRDGAALRIEAGTLTLRDVAFDVSAELAPRVHARLSAPRFELAGFSGWLPGLAASDVSGGVALETLEANLDPLSLRGAVVLDGVSAPVGETRGLLSGRLEGRGDALVGDAMELRVADQPFRLGLSIDSLAREPRAALRLVSEGVDAGTLVAGLSGKKGTLEGPLTFTSTLRAPLADPDVLLRALAGRVELGVTPGRLRGVSLLRSTFAALGGSGGLAGRLGGKDLERFSGDAFETLAGSFDVAGGQARTSDLHLVYRDYQVDLAGVFGLLDRSLDFRGKLTLFEDVDKALVEGARGVKREIPLASVRGTLDSPKVTVTPEAALAFAASVYGSGEQREKLERKLDKQLGEGSGKQVIDLLDSVLGGGAAKKKPAEEEPP
jgi:AsmA-like C-terminal region/AsmA family